MAEGRVGGGARGSEDASPLRSSNWRPRGSRRGAWFVGRRADAFGRRLPRRTRRNRRDHGRFARHQRHRNGSRVDRRRGFRGQDRKSTRLNSSHANISYAVFCLKKKKQNMSMSIDLYIDSFQDLIFAAIASLSAKNLVKRDEADNGRLRQPRRTLKSQHVERG